MGDNKKSILKIIPFTDDYLKQLKDYAKEGCYFYTGNTKLDISKLIARLEAAEVLAEKQAKQHPWRAKAWYKMKGKIV